MGGERRSQLKAQSVITSVHSLGHDPRSSSYLLLMKPNYMKERHPLVAHEDEKAQLALQLNQNKKIHLVQKLSSLAHENKELYRRISRKR